MRPQLSRSILKVLKNKIKNGKDKDHSDKFIGIIKFKRKKFSKKTLIASIRFFFFQVSDEAGNATEGS